MFERTLPGYARAVPTGRRKGQTEVDPYADPMSGADPEPTGMPWHRRVVEEVIRELATDPEAGLTRDEARSRLADHGPNLITTPRRWVRLQMLARQFADVLIWLLVAAALISGFLLDSWLDAAAIGAIVLLNAAIGYWQESRARTALDRLSDLQAPTAKVLREGETLEIPTSDIVPGDIAILEPGDRVPADGRVIGAIRLLVDESSLTGESAAISKSPEPVAGTTSLGDRSSMVHAGTLVVGGRGRCVVTATGRETEMGRIAELASGEAPLTPLEVAVRRIGRRIAVLAGGTAGLVFTIGLLRGFDPEPMLLVAIALAVAAIPEGLPAVITVSLAGGLQRMARRSAVVRRLAAVEALGAVDVICTDKTGTLTVPRLEVADVLFADGRRGLDLLASEDEAARLLALTAALCNDAYRSGEGWAGDPVEAALLEAVADSGQDPSQLRSLHPRLDEAGFDGKRKRMSTVHEVDGRLLLLVKGAPEVLVSLAASVYDGDRPVDLDDAAREWVLASAHGLASEGLRTLGFAVRELGSRPTDPASAEHDLVFLGIVAMREQIRPEVPEAVAAAARAGVRTVMVTGDHATTAAAVADSVGITDGEVMTGDRLARTPVEELTEEIDRYRVFARVDPVDKVKIVDAWKGAGALVAMTGDGVNDAPALRRADIGVAMGSGTDVARESAAMVLTDDNYASIVAAIAEGRRLFANLRNVVHYLLSANASEVLYVVAGFALFGHLGEPLLPVQLLWINLVSDSLPAVALGADRPASNPLEVPPGTGRDVLSGKNMIRLAIQGAILAAGAMAAFLGGTFVFDLGPAGAQTMVFSTLVLSQLLHALNVRHDPSGSSPPGRWLIAALAASAAIHLLVVYTPLGASVFRTVPLAPIPLAWTIGSSVATMIAVRAVESVQRR